jgi:hypothetical protein
LGDSKRKRYRQLLNVSDRIKASRPIVISIVDVMFAVVAN